MKKFRPIRYVLQHSFLADAGRASIQVGLLLVGGWNDKSG